MMCDGNLRAVKNYFAFNSKLIGQVFVPKIKFERCDQCDDKLLSGSEGEKILRFVKKKEEEAISALPVGDFVTAAQAADILEITKQAFSKNRKIRSGLIISITIDNKKLYLEKSVKLFGESGNGLFRLPQRKEYISESKSKTIKPFKQSVSVFSGREDYLQQFQQTDHLRHGYNKPKQVARRFSTDH